MNSHTRPTRLHHTAYVTKDLEKTRAFYEDVVGAPLVATWAEQEELFGKERTYAHCFFELEDGSALAFFQFEDDADDKEFGPAQAESPFIHVALNVTKDYQDAVIKRIEASNPAEGDYYVLDHGYCKSVYVRDPNRMLLEFTTDTLQGAEHIPVERKKTAHDDLKRWLSGDHTPNNDIR